MKTLSVNTITCCRRTHSSHLTQRNCKRDVTCVQVFSLSSISGKDPHKAIPYWIPIEWIALPMSWPCTAIYEQHRLRPKVSLHWEKANVKSVLLSDWLFCFSWVTRFRLILGEPKCAMHIESWQWSKKSFSFVFAFVQHECTPRLRVHSHRENTKVTIYFIFFVFAVLHCDFYSEFTTRRSVTDVTFAFTFGQYG